MNRFWKHFLNYWTEDRGLSYLFAITTLIIFILFPLQTIDIAGIIILKIFFTLLIVAGIVSFLKHKRQAVLVAAIAFFFLLTTWVSYFSKHMFIDIFNQIFSILFISSLTYLTLRRVFIDGHITYHRIVGAILAFLLIGLIWASFYELVFILNPAAFKFPSDIVTGNSISEFVYFSFVTLCTIGYGDLVPVDPVARSLAMLEGIVGVMYPAVLIGRLVSLQLSNRQ